ncbi:MAG: hypothetical protein RL213_2166 [Bacteroidota bacterium]
MGASRVISFIRRSAILALFLISCDNAIAQMTVIPSILPAQWVGLMSGPGVTISNITFTGNPVAAGRFHANSTGFGINHGIMLSTGNCSLSVGPNSSGSATDMLGTPGDPVLDSLARAQTYDAAIIEFDFIPQNDTVRFRYIFASEEYPEFVCSTFNDAFAFMISGPGYPNPRNIALIPGSANPVTINNVNSGSCGGSYSGNNSILTNSNLYVNNSGGVVTEMDGYTVPLYAIASVIPCQQYHLRISIADAGDERYESSVFFEEGSLMSAPVVEAGMARTLCPGDTSRLGGPVANGWSYQWSPSTGLNNPNSPNPVLTWPSGVSAPVQYLVTASNGSCLLRDSVLVNPAPSASAVVNATSACIGAPVTVDAQVTAPPGATLQWDFDGGTVLSGSGTGPYSVYYPASGTYSPSLSIGNLQCPDNSAHAGMVLIHPAPLAAAIADTVCRGLPTHFTNTSTISGGSITRNDWLFDDGSTSLLDDPLHVFPTSGSHTVRLFATSDFGCGDTADIVCRVHPLPEAILLAVDTAGCSPFRLNLEDRSNYNGSGGNVFRWFVDGILTDTISDPLLELSATGSYDVGLSVTDLNGCSDDTTVKDLLTVHPVPLADFLLSDSVVSEYDPVIIFSDASAGADWLQWDFGDGSISFEDEVTHSYAFAGYYTVTQFVKTDFECTDTLSRRILIEAESSFYIPSAFTPNGDGRNDVFKAEGRQVDFYRLYVFNRWGRIVFYSTDINEGWDGTFEGSESQQDVYDYLVEYSTSRDENIREAGKVMLLR